MAKFFRKNPNPFVLKSPNEFGLKNSKLWLFLAVFSISFAGLFSLPPVILRKSLFAPELAEKIFTKSLIIHVNLSVLFWMLAITAVFWSYMNRGKLSILNKIAPITAFVGAILITISPFIGDALPLKNNYVPILMNDVFKLGLSIFFAGIVLQAINTALNIEIFTKGINYKFCQKFALYSASLMFITSFACYILASHAIKKPSFTYENFEFYYEMLFWAFGHSLQYVYVQVLIFIWLWLADTSGFRARISSRFLFLILLINPIVTLPMPLVFAFYDVGSPEFISFFTQHMIYFNGISSFIIALIIIYGIFFPKFNKFQSYKLPQFCSLLFSIILFGIGGVLGLMITGNDATVPAHYHGSIVGISIAMMGIVYDILPRFGYRNNLNLTSKIQPVIYGVGQVFHITGLAVMGGYGALRKAPGTIEEINTTIGKIMFFSGGGLAILGGLLFAVIVIKALFTKREKKNFRGKFNKNFRRRNFKKNY